MSGRRSKQTVAWWSLRVKNSLCSLWLSAFSVALRVLHVKWQFKRRGRREPQGTRESRENPDQGTTFAYLPDSRSNKAMKKPSLPSRWGQVRSVFSRVKSGCVETKSSITSSFSSHSTEQVE